MPLSALQPKGFSAVATMGRYCASIEPGASFESSFLRIEATTHERISVGQKAEI
jgi:hypothetical protein